jgi:adenylate kinase family enzyme
LASASASAGGAARGTTPRVIVVGISGNGKTTLGKALAAKLDVPFVELDSLYHLPGWTEETPDRFREQVDAVTAGDGWVLDGFYRTMVGDITLSRADTVVWLDQPLPLVLSRLIRRAVRDVRTGRDLFNGNRQTWRMAFFTKDSLVGFAIKSHFRRRRIYPSRFAEYPEVTVVRLRSPRQVRRWLEAQ